MDSILDSIKVLLNVQDYDDAFDQELIMHINSVLMICSQLGLGPKEGFSIHGSEETWAQFLGDQTDVEAIKNYIYMKVRLVFDPPTNSFTLDAMKRMADEYEWRLNVQVESGGDKNV